jgi:anaerobic magnesium-protoporphyrin IX monomethyl ester cyclase
MARKVLLVIPPCFADQDHDFEVGFPVHLALLAQAVREVGWGVDYLDMALQEKFGEDSYCDLKQSLRDGDIGLVGISNHTVRTSVTTRLVAEQVEELRPEVPVVVGGVNATFMWRELLDGCTAIDYVLRGYAQAGLRALVLRLDGLVEGVVPGLVEREGEEFRVTPLRAPKLAELQTPSLAGLPVARYLKWSRVYPLLTHTGCGFACAFCTSVMPGPYQNQEIHRPIMDILAEMGHAADLGFTKFFMTANVFTSNRDRCLALCAAVVQAGIPERCDWACMTRVEFVDEELLQAMSNAGCTDIAFGVETAGVDQWKSLRKGRFCPDKIYRAFEVSRDAGLRTTAYLMLGHPDQTHAAVEATIDLVRDLDPDYRSVSFFQPFPGTSYWKAADRFGLSELAPLHAWNFHEAPICRTRHMGKDALIQAAIRLYLDRNTCAGIQPDRSSLLLDSGFLEEHDHIPEEAALALQRLLAGDTASRSLASVRSRYGDRGQLIALYWLSAAAASGALRMIDDDCQPIPQPVPPVISGTEEVKSWTQP